MNPLLSELTADEHDLWQRAAELWELSRTREVQRIREALHPDYVGWDMAASLPHDREAAIQSVTGESPGLLRYDLEPLSVRVYGGTAGVVHYRYDAVVGSDAGPQLQVRGKWTEVYVREGTHWLMVAVSGRPDPRGTDVPADTR